MWSIASSAASSAPTVSARRQVTETDDRQLDRRHQLEVVARLDQLGQVARAVEVRLDRFADRPCARVRQHHPDLERAEAPRELGAVVPEGEGLEGLRHRVRVRESACSRRRARRRRRTASGSRYEQAAAIGREGRATCGDRGRSSRPLRDRRRAVAPTAPGARSRRSRRRRASRGPRGERPAAMSSSGSTAPVTTVPALATTQNGS